MYELFLAALLVACLVAHFAVQAEPPMTPRDWMLEQARAVQTIPTKSDCYQSRYRRDKPTKMCISEMEWRRMHAEEIRGRE